MKKKLLFISSHLPSTKVPQAGQKIAYDKVKYLSAEYDVYLVSFINKFEKKYMDSNELAMCKEVHFIYLNSINKFFSILCNFQLPVRISVRASRKAMDIISKLEEQNKFENVHFEFTEVLGFRSLFPVETHSTITVHDVLFQSIDRFRDKQLFLFKWLFKLESNRIKRWEQTWYSTVNAITVLCEKDKNLLMSFGINDRRICVEQPKVDECFYKIDRKKIEPFSVLIFSAFNRKENQDGLLWFLESIFPKILDRYPDAKLYVIGAEPPERITKLANKNIIVTGFVEDPLYYFSKCSVAIAPLRLGAGVKIKVLQYLAAGLPVVSTDVGAEGIENEKLYIENEEDNFAKKVMELF